MRISSNFSTPAQAPAFKQLYKKEDARKVIKKLSEDQYTKEAISDAMKKLEEHAKDIDIVVQTYDGEGNGILVQQLNTRTLRVIKNISSNKTDFMKGLYAAIKRLNNTVSTEDEKSAKRGFPLYSRHIADSSIAFTSGNNINPENIAGVGKLNKLA